MTRLFSLFVAAPVFALQTAPLTQEIATPRRSEALPWIDAPPLLDGSVPGDYGFDPLGMAKNKALLSYFREAEIRHSRLACLASIGWVVSEMLDPPLSKLCGMPCALVHEAFAPSILNGGLYFVFLFFVYFIML